MNVYLVKWVRKTYGQQLIRAASENEAKERLRSLDKAELLDFDQDGNDIHEDECAEPTEIKLATREVLRDDCGESDDVIDEIMEEGPDNYTDALERYESQFRQPERVVKTRLWPDEIARGLTDDYLHHRTKEEMEALYGRRKVSAE